MKLPLPERLIYDFVASCCLMKFSGSLSSVVPRTAVVLLLVSISRALP